MLKAIQYTDSATDKPAADAMLAHLATQVDYLGGRVLPPRCAHAPWTVQAFFSYAADPPVTWLPDGCRVVFIPDAIRGWLLHPGTVQA